MSENQNHKNPLLNVQNGNSVIDRLKLEVKKFPSDSGVYIMKNSSDKIIYVGKAKSIRSRVRSYLGQNLDSPKTAFLVKHINTIEYIVTKTEEEAFLVEASLIKKHKPRYNIRLKDDKSYPYIRVSLSDAFPRIYLSRKVLKDGSIYFGPFSSGWIVRETIRFLNQTFKIRDCTNAFMSSRKRPCMTYQIGRCKAPCVDLVSSEEYSNDIQGALKFLRGSNKSLLKKIEKEMDTAAKEERFEIAAKLRNSLYSAKQVLEKQSVVGRKVNINQDVISFCADERGTLFEMLHLRKGRMIGTRSHFLSKVYFNNVNDQCDLLINFLNQYYVDNFIPDQILTPIDLGEDLRKLFERVLFERSEFYTKIEFPTDGQGQRLLNIADKNAQDHFKEHVQKTDIKMKGLKMIQEKLKLPKLPLKIECYDISHFQGKETVGSQVVFEEGVPSKEHYRRYKIKTVKGNDDFASMKEVLTRRLHHTEYDDPHLILIDGGKGQLNKIVKVLKDLKREDIPVASLAKARTLGDFKHSEVTKSKERVFLPGRANPVTFASNAEALHILVGLRDEAHRFALSYHRKLRHGSSLESLLDSITGLGKKRKKKLLKKFSSIEMIKSASVEEISQIPGFNRVLAERILLQLSEYS